MKVRVIGGSSYRDYTVRVLYDFSRLEQELLARIISQMNNQSSDPTLKEAAENVSVSSVEAGDDVSSYNWIGMNSSLFIFAIDIIL